MEIKQHHCEDVAVKGPWMNDLAKHSFLGGSASTVLPNGGKETSPPVNEKEAVPILTDAKRLTCSAISSMYSVVLAQPRQILINCSRDEDILRDDNLISGGSSVISPATANESLPNLETQDIPFPADAQQQLVGAQSAKSPSKIPLSLCVHPKTIFTRPFQIPESQSMAFPLSSVLRGAWALVLARYLETNDVVFGSTNSDFISPISGVQSTLKAFTAVMPFHMTIERKDRILDFLAKVRQRESNMIQQNSTWLRDDDSIGGVIPEVRGFHSTLIIQPPEVLNGVEGTEIPEDSIRHLSNISSDLDPCHLVVRCTLESSGSAEVRIISDGRRATFPQDMHTVFNHLEHVVTQLITEKTSMVSDVDLCGPRDLSQIEIWNKPDTALLVSACVQDLISDQVQRRPEQEAIHAWDGTLTYVELDDRSSRLALHLTSLGIRPETMVATCFEKSKWAAVAFLAILKAGGVFVPLDPAQPAIRQRSLLDKMNVQLIITSQETISLSAGISTQSVVLSDDLLAQLPNSGDSQHVSPGGCRPHNAAYVMFTSGSTGEPNGIIVEQAALCSSIMGHGGAYGLDPTSRVLQFSSFTFDSCLSEMLTPLVFGGTVCMPSDAQRLQDVAKFIRDAEVNVAILTPSFASTLKPEEIPSMKTLVLSGEVISKDELKKWYGRVQLINAYGPSEVCVDCTSYAFQSQDDSPTNIGFAHSGTCWIVEPGDHNRLCPIGCVGELLVQGPALARGYLGNEDKTRASFLDSVAWQQTSKDGEKKAPRLYKTGDLVKYNYDGSIEYIGRKDTQVKLRGQRVELGEIEYSIRKALPSVEHVVVETIQQASHQVLVAFLTLAPPRGSVSADRKDPDGLGSSLPLLPMNQETMETLISLANELETVLPSYMIPTLFFPLRQMPFLSSMKINRKNLKTRAGNLSKDQLATFSLGFHQAIEPTTKMELQIRDLWADVLNMKAETIGKHANFLRIGGDSLKAIELVSRARERGINLSVSSILKDGRLSRVATSVVSASTKVTVREAQVAPFSLLPDHCLDDILSQARVQCELSNDQVIEDAYPCTSMQEDLMVLALKQPSSSIVRYVYRLASQVDPARFKHAWNQTLLQCANLRTRVVCIDGNAMQVVIKDDICWDSDINSIDSETGVEPRMTVSMGYGSRLCRYSLATGIDGQVHFIWTMHYAILDPWSGDLMRQALHSAYNETKGLTLQPYNRLIKYIADLDNDECRGYWRSQLQGVKPTIFPANSPQHGPKPKIVESGRFKRLVTKGISFPRSPVSSITRAMVLRAAWAIVLARYCNTNDVCFGTSISGRNAPIPGLDAMVGLVPATVPIRIRIDHGQPVEAFFQTIQTQASNMVAFEQYGLHNIMKHSAEAQAACDFTSLMIIQPAQLLNSAADSDSLMMSVGEGLNGYFNYPLLQGYFMYPLVVQIVLHENHVELDAVYDPQVMADSQVMSLSKYFVGTMQDLRSADETAPIDHFF